MEQGMITVSHRKPISGDTIFNALKEEKTIVMAANVRMTRGVAKGIMRAASDTDSAVIFELARSESDLSGGYTGMRPEDYFREITDVAHDVDHDIYTVHADHISIKKGDEDDLGRTKELIEAQIRAGYTSFAVDASHLFDFHGGNLREELADNIRCTTEIAHFIRDNIGDRTFGLEVEVGEIGKTDRSGRVLTSPAEAVEFLTALKENDVHPNLLAIANGSAHGNTLDENGNVIPQVSVDIPQTRAVAKAISDAGFDVRIAQHGITGTPRELINLHFPKGDILKGNVGTHWQNIFYDVVKIYNHDLFERMKEWTVEKYRSKTPDATDEYIFKKNCKQAFKPFFRETHSLGPETEAAMEAMAYSEALLYFRSFSSEGTAASVRKYMEGGN
ncbi:MAG: class II fructose-bisphosphate aldolase [Thermoplasmatota archaeon]